MRRIFYKMFAGLICLMGLLESCENKSLGDAEISTIESSELVSTLSTINETLLSEHLVTRSNFLRGLAIASADISGAYEFGKIGARLGSIFSAQGMILGAGIGGLIGGVGASYAAYCASDSEEEDLPGGGIGNEDDGGQEDDEMDGSLGFIIGAYGMLNNDIDIDDNEPTDVEDSLMIYIPAQFASCINLGRMHNAILRQAMYPAEYAIAEDDVLSEEEAEIIYSEEFETAYNSQMELYSTLSVEDYAVGTNLSDQVMNLFLSVYNQYPETSEDVWMIINLYSNAIAESEELTDNEKLWIYNGLAVAAYSFEYWLNENHLN